MPSKQVLLETLISSLQQELDSITRSAQAAHEAATHEESKAEDAHDTRGLEASYLAGAQMARAESLKKVIISYQHMKPRDFKRTDSIAAGALIELDLDGKKLHCFLVPQGGGTTVTVEGKRVQVITPQSPLGEALIGRRVGDAIEIENPKGELEYEIVSIS